MKVTDNVDSKLPTASTLQDMAVELVSYHEEQCHHRHVKKEEAYQASSAEVAKKGIHPNSN
ncbi:hypothetical protein FQN60_013994 [Etheostoma spectabile]|uniref:Uncharacterized protein n=1 Tax=Etheostoma spectabile TaxID=54343 RepID=A0A5J5DAY1_9PERO|nr:hypothetical protein FQN60_013994 [Etheostoma spectabile]